MCSGIKPGQVVSWGRLEKGDSRTDNVERVRDPETDEIPRTPCPSRRLDYLTLLEP